MKATTYHIGGYLPAAPVQNRASEYDSVANTFTTWNTAGTQTAQRALTAAEQARFAAQDAEDTGIVIAKSLRTKASTALAVNNTYIALASPTAGQTTAQVQRLSKECNALIRLVLGQLDADDA